jgi:hypothetical protein
VGEVYLLNAGTTDLLPETLGFDTVDARLVRPGDVTFDIDLVIEMGVNLPVEWLRRVRALGARIVTFYVGNTYAAQAEGPIFGKGGGAFVGTPWHEMWTLPQYMKTSAPLLATVGRVPVHALPHVWSPLFIDRDARAVAASGREFGFRHPGKGQGWRAAIMEPNISVAKACFIPMLVCDEAFRTEPDALASMMVMNSVHMKEHLTFNRFATHLDLTRAGKASYEPRLPFVQCMVEHRLDVVVSHQWENAQNYLYYDALYGGYPLIHNSDLLRDAGLGFHYPGFEAIKGAQALLQAWRQPEEHWDAYRRNAAAFLRTLAPDDDRNARAFAERIEHLFGGVQ